MEGQDRRVVDRLLGGGGVLEGLRLRAFGVGGPACRFDRGHQPLGQLFHLPGSFDSISGHVALHRCRSCWAHESCGMSAVMDSWSAWLSHRAERNNSPGVLKTWLNPKSPIAACPTR